MQTRYDIGSVESKIRSAIQRMGGNIREQAEAIGMPHATLGRRLHDPGEFTVAELRKIAAAYKARYNLGYQLLFRRTDV